MSPAEPARHLSAFHLEAVQVGVASAGERAWVAEHPAGCAKCAALAKLLESYRQEFADRRSGAPERAAPGG